MVVGVADLCLPASTRTTITTRTASPAAPQAMGGIPPPSGGLLANIASLFGAAGGDIGGFEADLTEMSSGRSGSLISGDFIPAASAASATQTTGRKESPR